LVAFFAFFLWDLHKAYNFVFYLPISNIFKYIFWGVFEAKSGRDGSKYETFMTVRKNFVYLPKSHENLRFSQLFKITAPYCALEHTDFVCL